MPLSRVSPEIDVDAASATRSVRAPRTTSAPPSGPFVRDDVVDDAYRIGKILGVGGMGIVYEAEDIRLARKVAIKVSTEPENDSSLLAEARALAAIRHPGVVTVHAMGKWRNREYLVLERLFGSSLQARLDDAKRTRRAFSIDEVLDLLTGVADALAAAHRVGIAHRDLKPGNIVLCGGRIVLVDFGLFVPEVEVAHNDAVAGSAEFMAPEVISHRVVPGEGPLVDLYAFGIVAYELLTGRTPFVTPDFQSTLKRHLSEAPREVVELRADCPPALAKLVTELLAKDPADRPGTAEEVLWRLYAVRSPSGLGAGIRPFRVLVVDDDPHVASILRRSLNRAMPQLVVEAETDPRAALAEIEQRPPDMVFLDLRMPVMNGIEVAMALRALKSTHKPRVVGTSSEASPTDVAVLRELGVEEFVPKDDRFVARAAALLRDLRHA